MHYFIAIEPPKEVVEQIGEFSKTIQNYDLIRGNFSKSEKMHITLKFLGDMLENKVVAVKDVLNQTKFTPFEISLKGLGGFPNENYVKVLWVGLDKGIDIVTKLQTDINEKLAKIGFQKRPQILHLTLARVNSVRDKSDLKNLFDKHRNMDVGNFWCDKIYLMKSELTPAGHVYTKL